MCIRDRDNIADYSKEDIITSIKPDPFIKLWRYKRFWHQVNGSVVSNSQKNHLPIMFCVNMAGKYWFSQLLTFNNWACKKPCCLCGVSISVLQTDWWSTKKHNDSNRRRK